MFVGLRASTANISIDNGPYKEFIFKHFQVAYVDEESATVILVSWSVYKRNSHLKPWVGYEWDFLPLHKSSLDNVFYKPLSHTQLHDRPIQELAIPISMWMKITYTIYQLQQQPTKKIKMYSTD